MKLKHRALALILTLLMVLTYMPAMAFAEPDEGTAWTIEAYTNEYRLLHEDSYVELMATITLPDGDFDYSDFEYSWFMDDEQIEDWCTFDGYSVYHDAYTAGTYTCVAREIDNTATEQSATFNVRTWSIPENFNDYELPIGGKVILDATPEADYDAHFTYQWQKENPENEEFENIAGATQATYTVTSKGEYRCSVRETLDEYNIWELTYHAFVYQDNDSQWWVDDHNVEAVLIDGEAKLNIEIEEETGFSGNYTYIWTKYNNEQEKYLPVSGASGRSIIVKELGSYRCYVKESTQGDDDVVYFEVDTWGVKPKKRNVEIFKGATAKLELEFTGSVPDGLTYEWSRYDDTEGEYTSIEGDSNELTIDEEGEYRCIIRNDSEENFYSKSVYFDALKLDKSWRASAKNSEVEVKVGKTALLETVVEGTYGELSYKWYKEEYYDGEPVYTLIDGATEASYEAKESGLFVCGVTNTTDGETETDEAVFYVYDETVIENGIEYRLLDNHSAVAYGSEEIKGAATVKSGVKFSDGKTYPVTTIGYFGGCPQMTSVNLPSTITAIWPEAFVNTGLKSIVIPSSVRYVGEHAIGYNSTYDDATDIETFTYVPGFVIFGKTGSEAQKYAQANALTFTDPAAGSQSTASAAAAAAEAARQGIPDSKIPKVKGVKKPAAKKTSITVKWTKLTSKQQKKAKATKYEIWVCPNKAFGAADTKIKTVGKGKSSAKITGLKKNTKYYVKVRAIRTVGSTKYVGKWSARKTVKTPKK